MFKHFLVSVLLISAVNVHAKKKVLMYNASDGDIKISRRLQGSGGNEIVEFQPEELKGVRVSGIGISEYILPIGISDDIVTYGRINAQMTSGLEKPVIIVADSGKNNVPYALTFDAWQKKIARDLTLSEVYVAYDAYGDEPENAAWAKKLFAQLQEKITASNANDYMPAYTYLYALGTADIESFVGLSWLMQAIDDNNLNVINLLLDKGASVTTLPRNGQTPEAKTITALMLAVNTDNIAIVERVLKAVQLQHANINQKDAYGRTALWIAAEKDNAQIVQLLLNAGADLTIQPNGTYRKAYSIPDLISNYCADTDKGIAATGLTGGLQNLIGQYAGSQERRAERQTPSWMEVQNSSSDSDIDTSQDSSTSAQTGSAAVGTTSPLAPAVRSAAKAMDTSE